MSDDNRKAIVNSYPIYSPQAVQDMVELIGLLNTKVKRLEAVNEKLRAQVVELEVRVSDDGT